MFNFFVLFLELILDPSEEIKSTDPSQRMLDCRWKVLYWFVAFTIKFKRRKKSLDKLSESSIAGESTADTTTETSTTDPQLSPSPSQLSDDSNSRQYETLCEGAEVIRGVLYSTRENVIYLHEILRQVSETIIYMIA